MKNIPTPHESLPVTLTLEAKEIQLLCDILLSISTDAILENLKKDNQQQLEEFQSMKQTKDIVRIIKDLKTEKYFEEDVQELVDGILDINVDRHLGRLPTE